MSEHHCQADIYDGRFGAYRCTRQGKVLEDDKWYCRQHSPSAKNERDRARDAAWETRRKAESEAREQRRQEQQETNRRAACYPQFLAALQAAANALDAVGAHVPSEQAREALAEAQA